MYQKASVAVVIPAYNEARLLPITLSKLPHYVDHVFVIDDGSTDGTAAAAKRMSDPRISVIVHDKNRGVGRAIVSGYKAALTACCDLIVVMGGDDQMDPNELQDLLIPLTLGDADYVKGNRLGHPENKMRMPMIRRLGTLCLSHLTRIATGLSPLQDSQCGFTAITKQALSSLPIDELFPRYGYPNDLLSMLALQRLRVRDVVVTPIYGSEHSGLRVHRVLLPLCGILCRATIRRLLAKIRPTLPMVINKGTKRPRSKI